MIPEPRVTRKPAGGKASALTPSRKIEPELLRDETWVYVGTVGTDGVDALLKKNPFPYQHGASPGPPSFQNSWTNVSGGQPVRFSLNHSGWLRIHGDFTGGADDTTVFTLPAEFRPAYDHPYIIPTTNPEAFAIIRVQADGQVVFLGTQTALATIPGLLGGTYGSATQVAQVTVNTSGQVIAIANVAIQITESQVTNLTTDLAAKTTPETVPVFGGAHHRVRLQTSATAGTAEVAGPNLLVPLARLGTGTTGTGTNFLRDDGTWAAPSGTGGGVTLETSLVLGLGL